MAQQSKGCATDLNVARLWNYMKPLRSCVGSFVNMITSRLGAFGRFKWCCGRFGRFWDKENAAFSPVLTNLKQFLLWKHFKLLQQYPDPRKWSNNARSQLTATLNSVSFWVVPQIMNMLSVNCLISHSKRFQAQATHHSQKNRRKSRSGKQMSVFLKLDLQMMVNNLKQESAIQHYKYYCKRMLFASLHMRETSTKPSSNIFSCLNAQYQDRLKSDRKFVPRPEVSHPSRNTYHHVQYVRI